MKQLIKQLIDIFILGKHRLEKIEMLPLESSLKDAIALYGEPNESQPDEEAPEVTEHSFRVGNYHEVLAKEYQGTIQSIVYWSEAPSPNRDLNRVLEYYKENSQWDVVEEGYLLQRQDVKMRVWCSAIPAIGVGLIDYLNVHAELKLANDLKKIDALSDIIWAHKNVIWEFQKRFRDNNDRRLFEFADKSKQIAVSDDGQAVLIVRDHHAYEVDDGFMEINAPPESNDGYSTQVINCFSNGSCWIKTTLPRNACVTVIEFRDGDFHIEISQTETGRAFVFNSYHALFGISLSNIHQEEEMWKNIEKLEAKQEQKNCS